MPRIVALVAAFSILSAGHLPAQAVSPDEIRIRELIAAHQRASEHSDLRGLVDLYAADAEMVSGSGKRTRGRDAIESYYRGVIESPVTKGGRHHTHPPETVQVRFVTNDVALVDVASVNVGGTDSTGVAMADSRIMLTTVWRRQPSGWVVVEQRSLPAPKP